ncbi:MAG TPA: bifunctional oligoribonuclease/PAP phosphatase NrnA [Acholeplasma sp.]|jgi:phosphoesterase RecJ-like protein
MLELEVLKRIEAYDTIIIHRHHHPDLDAYGSQLSLKEAICLNYPNKKVYAVGDKSSYVMDVSMDEVIDETYHDALVIVIDTAVKHLVSDDRYTLAKELIVIDHHLNDTDLNPTIFLHKPEWLSATEIVADLLKRWNFKVNSTVATHLFAGMVGDSGRYMFINKDNASHIFEMSAYVATFEPNIQSVYDYLYLEPLARRLVKNQFQEFKLTPNNVAYQINTLEKVVSSGLDFMSVSRGMLGLMAGIKEVRIWASFTENENHQILAELRSRGIEIVDIAKKYGGGGHANACGCTLTSWDQVQQVINDLDERGKII